MGCTSCTSKGGCESRKGEERQLLRLAGHGNEAHREDRPPLEPVAALGEHHQLLVPVAHRDHQTAAGLELLLERRGDARRGGGDDDGVEGRVLGPALVAVAGAHLTG